MKIVMPGGSGQVGQVLCRAFTADGHDVVVLTRKPQSHPDPQTQEQEQAASALISHVVWDGRTLGPWASELEAADVVINLVGRSVNCRYTPRNRRAIMQSRVESTRVIGEAIGRAAAPPPLWLQASTATIYAHRYDAGNDESTGVLGGSEAGVPDTWRFSIDVAQAWEQTALEASTPATRKVLLRSAMVMSPDRGGVFDVLLGLVRRGLGGRHGDGRQYVSWIHEHDFVQSLYWLVDHDLAGPVNLASPHPLPNADFMRALRKAWGVSWGLPASRWMLEVGTFLLRSETELVLKSRRVIPGRLLDSGFSFRYPDWRGAAEELCRRWRQQTA